MTTVSAVSTNALRSYLRGVSLSKRNRLCGVAAVSAYPSIEIRSGEDGPSARTLSVLTCNHLWTCPTCAAAIRAERAERIRLAILGSKRRWRMLTVTSRHHGGEDLRTLYAGNTAAWRETRQGGAVQAIWSAKVQATARATEITFSPENGWHVHFHVLLCGEDWTEEETSALFERWAAMVRKHLGPGHEPARAHGLHWSRAHDGGIAAYVAKLGMEVSGYAKRSDWSLTPWELAEEGVKGNARCKALWNEYELATKGRRAIEMDERAHYFAEIGEQIEAYEREAKRQAMVRTDDFKPEEPVQLNLFPEEVRALKAGERVLPAYTWHLLRAIESDIANAESTLRRATEWALEVGGELVDLERYRTRFEVRPLDVGSCVIMIGPDPRPVRPLLELVEEVAQGPPSRAPPPRLQVDQLAFEAWAVAS